MREITPHLTTIHDTLRDTPTASRSARWLHQPVGSASESLVASSCGGNAVLWRVEEGAEDRFDYATIVAVEGWRGARPQSHV